MPNALVPLASFTLASAQATVVFNGIPSNGFKDLRIVINATASAGYNVPVAFNGDTTASNYPSVYATGNGSSAGSGTLNNYIGGVYTGNLSTTIIDIMDHSATNKQKTWLSHLSVSSNNVSIIAGRWTNTAAITSVAFTVPGTWSAGSTFNLFGVIG